MQIPIRALGLTCLACALGGPAAAQTGASGSETFRSSARGTPTAAGSATSSSYQVEAEVTASSGTLSTSAGYRFEGGVSWAAHELGQDGPVVFGFLESSGWFTGGETRRLVGAGFQAPGAGLPYVSIGQVGVPGIQVLNDSLIEFPMPAGVSSWGNPVGVSQSQTRLETALGDDRVNNSYRYDPSVRQYTTGQWGESVTVAMHANPGDYGFLLLAIQNGGGALPVPPLSGALELLINPIVLLPLAPLATGDLLLEIPLPALPLLKGSYVYFQGGVFTSLSPLEGSFTNRLALYVHA